MTNYGEQLTPGDLSTLRQHNIIAGNEIAFKVGDLYIAENVLTGERRQLNFTVNNLLNESKRQVLKG
jgi:hypothetical protein